MGENFPSGQKRSQLHSACERCEEAETYDMNRRGGGKKWKHSRHIAVGKYGRKAKAALRPIFSSQTISPGGLGAPWSSWGDTRRQILRGDKAGSRATASSKERRDHGCIIRTGYWTSKKEACIGLESIFDCKTKINTLETADRTTVTKRDPSPYFQCYRALRILRRTVISWSAFKLFLTYKVHWTIRCMKQNQTLFNVFTSTLNLSWVKNKKHTVSGLNDSMCKKKKKERKEGRKKSLRPLKQTIVYSQNSKLFC